jgi:SRSO17 transposase
MADLAEFERYMNHLSGLLGHADRQAGFIEYGRGLMLPIERKSVEPLAAHTDPWHVSSKHQSLHHMVAKSDWSDEAVLGGVREWVSPGLKLEKDCYWIVDDTGFPKKGQHSVGVARQYCGQLGKKDNCQVAVSLSLASARGSVPIAFRLYLPEEWASDNARREKAGVPAEIEFATKPQIALEQIRAAKAAGVPVGVVLGDAGYGNSVDFRESLSEQGLKYCVGVQASTTVWTGELAPLPPKPKKSKRGRPATRLRRATGHEPVSVKELAVELPTRAWRTVGWREGSNERLVSRFAALRVRAAHQDWRRGELREEEWLLIEWPNRESEPVHYWLCNLPASTALRTMVNTAMMRWRIERDYQELKQEFGLSHYEGRGWRGFHHHATLCIAAYGFLLNQRLKGGGIKKNSAQSKASLLPEGYTPRGSRKNATPRSRLHRHASSPVGARYRSPTRSLSMLRAPNRNAKVVTQ